jgi:hypothetical protein
MNDAMPSLALAGLGAFHGLNPAMGWLFAVALGLHRQSRSIVFASVLPIAVGHALSVVAVATLLVTTGLLIPHNGVRIGSGVLLLAWGAYHWRFGHRHRVRFGMLIGFWGLAVWSFLMATTHGAGVMLWPALMPLCMSDSFGRVGPSGSFAVALAGVGIHTAAMAATTIVMAGLVYEWLGLGLLSRIWINIDLLWTCALVVTGMLLLAF